ncbi:hypothetical protein NOR_00500 [Metarhizium rileyi]|uniref:Uncharacterized protein n=1 Tax=Metarhizium rileyi (strain RCEF 4871) TaxID=1649241 RepID=A0A167KM45_METRR|nr:hypothetical protein NOR_00500 [Metarhizium rileyi RCEF 4871]
MARIRDQIWYIVNAIEAKNHVRRLDTEHAHVDVPSGRVHDGLKRQRGTTAVAGQNVVATEAGAPLKE